MSDTSEESEIKNRSDRMRSGTPGGSGHITER